MAEKEQCEKLKAFILCEADNIAAFAPFDDLGNNTRILFRMWFDLGDIIPELKGFCEEVISFYRQQGQMDRIPQGWLWQEKDDS